MIENMPARSLSAAKPSGLGPVLAIAGLAVAAALLVVITGGVLGPLGPWCLTPLALAAAMGRGERLALGAAASLTAVGVAALGGLTFRGVSFEPAVDAVLSGFALASAIIALAAGLVVLQRNLAREDQRRRLELARASFALDQQPHLLMALDAAGRISAAWGVEPRGAVGYLAGRRLLADLVADVDRERLAGAIGEALAHGSAEVGFAPAVEPEVWLELSLRQVGSGRLMGSLRDATEARRREAALEAARAEAEAQNTGKSRFLANMSHELRTPLNAIMGFSDIMRQRLFGPLSDRYAEYADLVHEAGDHLLDLINDVLDMSKIEAERYELARETFDARDGVSGVLRLMRGQAERAGVQLRGLLPNDPLEILADRRALKQIALNLVSNALKFTPRGGAVTVALRGDDDVLELVVADTGVGIGAEDLQRLGRPYEQAGGAAQKAAGVGLGLSLVRSFSRLHGGEMIIESQLGEGTTVTVRLPVIEPSSVA
ncbi:sensor histidine kinase [Phenylobacterium koreense]|uniref:histidine kinase n=1 Tax=Phenylobacterium koreense TaxID=266125 RepID=A0ABV2EEJ9_9CAUL